GSAAIESPRRDASSKNTGGASGASDRLASASVASCIASTIGHTFTNEMPKSWGPGATLNNGTGRQPSRASSNPSATDAGPGRSTTYAEFRPVRSIHETSTAG